MKFAAVCLAYLPHFNWTNSHFQPCCYLHHHCNLHGTFELRLCCSLIIDGIEWDMSCLDGWIFRTDRLLMIPLCLLGFCLRTSLKICYLVLSFCLDLSFGMGSLSFFGIGCLQIQSIAFDPTKFNSLVCWVSLVRLKMEASMKTFLKNGFSTLSCHYSNPKYFFTSW